MTRLEIEPGVEAHASGALSIPSSRAVILADVHLGYAWAQRRRGELGPLEEGGVGARIDAVLDELAPREVVLLGDVVHAPNPGPEERSRIEGVLRRLLDRARVTLVRGNHDRRFARDFGHLDVSLQESWSCEEVFAIHGDKLNVAIPEGPLLAVGHLHPCWKVYDAAGVGHRMPVFVRTERGLVLPAFSPFARGFDIWDPWPEELRGLLGKPDRLFAVTGKRVVEVPRRR